MAVRLWIAIRVYLFWLGFFVIARLGFLLYHLASTRSLRLGEVGRIFASGLRLDLSSAAYLSVVPVLLLAVSGYRPIALLTRRVVWVWLVGAVIAMVLLVVADLELSVRWGRRIDASVLPYLRTPREAWASAGASPIFALGALLLVVCTAAIWVARRWIDRPLAAASKAHWATPVPFVLAVGGLVVAGRGGVQTWPLTISSAYHSPNAFANLAAQNAAWGFFDSIYRRQYDRSNPFRSMADSVAAETIETAQRQTGDRRVPPIRSAKPNVLLIVWESASARAFGSLGGVRGVTPRFDSLVHAGMLFRRFYAAGDRTDKGIAAILSSFPGIPRGSILKVPSKTTRLPSLSDAFRTSGYSTGFYYGGELEFASLKAYVVSAGFDRVVGKADFPRSAWNSKWGAHDGVVADRLLADLNGAREPFFDVWLTLSSHEPFETPVAPTFPGGDWQSQFFNSLAYTDRVLGDLIDRARQSPWWPNTLVIIVADHGRRVVPLDQDAPSLAPDVEYHIPMLWLGGALTVADSLVDEIGTQLDIAPTLVDLIGGNQTAFRYGRSLLRPVVTPHAYYGFDEGFGIATAAGQLVYDSRGNRAIWTQGVVTDGTRQLAKALLQQSYQEYLDR